MREHQERQQKPNTVLQLLTLVVTYLKILDIGSRFKSVQANHSWWKFKCIKSISHSKNLRIQDLKILKILPKVSSLLDSNSFSPLFKIHQVSAHLEPLNASNNSSSTVHGKLNQKQLIS
ncbi:hypothetical protein ACKWTF_007568 [Chironomus riparius]